jgi:hypothetical protein
MDMEVKAVISCVSCGDTRPDGHNMVGECSQCHKMVWVSQNLNDKIKESDCPIWCTHCIEAAGERGDTTIRPVSYEELLEAKKEEKAETEKGMWGVPFPLVNPQAESEYFEVAKSANEQLRKKLDKSLPAMCTAYMSRLKVFHSTLDLSIACTVASFVEMFLVERRERLGEGNVFEGYNRDQEVTIMAFIFGVKEAVRLWHKKNPNKTADNYDPDSETFDPSGLSAEDMAAWEGGMKYWSEELRKVVGEED